ncbi:MAG: hypothetical protein P8I91_07845 [Phycisphaerales bacterium]|nr:hypothetical protein [Phycisphaerales bacterium]
MAHQCILLLLAVAMPMCCCVMNGFAVAGGDSDATITCCCSADACETDARSTLPAESSGCNTCSCVKTPATFDNWTPPSDDIGIALPDSAYFAVADAITCQVQMNLIDAVPPGHANTSAPPLRHACILQI